MAIRGMTGTFLLAACALAAGPGFLHAQGDTGAPVPGWASATVGASATVLAPLAVQPSLRIEEGVGAEAMEVVGVGTDGAVRIRGTLRVSSPSPLVVLVSSSAGIGFQAAGEPAPIQVGEGGLDLSDLRVEVAPGHGKEPGRLTLVVAVIL